MKLLNLVLTFLFLVVAPIANANILWVGGEDVDFPMGSSPSCWSTTAGYYRSGYSRGAVCATGYVLTSNSFSSGAVTSVWFSARVNQVSVSSGNKWFGLGKSGTGNSIWLGCGSSASKIALYKYDGSTFTLLASESGNSYNYGNLSKFDVNVINYGASATVNVYYNGASSPVISYSGDVTSGGNTSLNDFRLLGTTANAGTHFSELIVSDSDTRLLSAVTLAPTSAGTTNNWTGAYTDVNETTINDATTISSTNSGDNFQCNLTDLPVTNVSVSAIRISARAAKSGTGIGSLAPGVYTNSTISVPTAAALVGAYSTVETIYQTNPVTSSAWTPADTNSLQINLQSAP